MNKIYMIIMTLLMLFIFTSVNGQEKITRENWQLQISDFTSLKKELTAKIANLQKDMSDLQTTLEKKIEESKIAEEEYLSTTGGKDKYETYKKKLDKLYNICKNFEGKREDADKIFLELDTNLKCHPDFESKYKDIKIRLDNASYRNK